MKKLAAIALGLCLVGTLAHAKNEEKSKPTAEQKKVRKEIVEKYDANKDGKLDKDERAKISSDDKKKLEKAGFSHHKKGEGKKKK